MQPEQLSTESSGNYSTEQISILIITVYISVFCLLVLAIVLKHYYVLKKKKKFQQSYFETPLMSNEYTTLERELKSANIMKSDGSCPSVYGKEHMKFTDKDLETIYQNTNPKENKKHDSVSINISHLLKTIDNSRDNILNSRVFISNFDTPSMLSSCPTTINFDYATHSIVSSIASPVYLKSKRKIHKSKCLRP